MTGGVNRAVITMDPAFRSVSVPPSSVSFTDSANVKWLVSEDPSGLGGLRDWERRRLRFESRLGVWYLQPVPDNWQTFPKRRLQMLCDAAQVRTDAA